MPREIENNAYAKFRRNRKENLKVAYLVTNLVHYFGVSVDVTKDKVKLFKSEATIE